jgi:hypothetical protein
MDVAFTRTGERRYSVSAGALAVHPAPGYDDDIPHDLVHLAVELACDIPMGVFGQLAAGGTAGLARPADGTADRKLRKRGMRIADQHIDDLKRSEALAYRVTIAFKRGDRPAPDPQVERVCALLDELSARWRELRVGASMTVPWAPSPPRRAPRADRLPRQARPAAAPSGRRRARGSTA